MLHHLGVLESIHAPATTCNLTWESITARCLSGAESRLGIATESFFWDTRGALYILLSPLMPQNEIHPLSR